MYRATRLRGRFLCYREKAPLAALRAGRREAHDRRGPPMPARKTKETPERIHTVLLQFRVLLRSIKQHYQSMEERTGVAGAQLWALSEIAADPGLRVSDLARRLALHVSTASNLVRRMEAQGVVSRDRVEGDQRVVRVGLTAKGRAALRRAPRPAMGLLQRALLDLPPRRLSSLQKELEELLAHVARRDSHARTTMISDLFEPPESSARRRPAPGAARSRR
jgi:DNA-binding MarR family transcriptional regulator